MDFGLDIFPSHEALGPAALGSMVEERGFESLFFPEHPHIPVSRRTPYPPGGDLPREYARTLDLFVALTAAAAATTRLLVGAGICLAVERAPIVTAHAAASVDLPSGRRLPFGVRAGPPIQEPEDHG